MDKIFIAICNYIYNSNDEQDAWDEVLKNVITWRQTFVDNNKPSPSRDQILVDRGITR